jgi:hypothetical protein
MAPSTKEQETLEIEEMRSAHHIDDIFLIDMSEAGMTPEAPNTMKADATSMPVGASEKLTIQQLIKRQRDKVAWWASIILTVLLHAFYAMIQRVSLKSFADGRRRNGINDIRTLKACNNSDQVMKYTLAHIT